MNKSIKTLVVITTIITLFVIELPGQDKKTGNADKKEAVPIIVDGETQIVSEFNDPETWIIHDLWVETEFDTDGDDKPDRMHVLILPLQNERNFLQSNLGENVRLSPDPR